MSASPAAAPGGPETKRPVPAAYAAKSSETGDIPLRNVAFRTPVSDEFPAVPGAGGYAVAMASNYNPHVRPAVALVDRGRVRLIRRRETHADIWRLER